MRTRLYLDPKIIKSFHPKEDFPSLRQILDELVSKANIDICLFSDETDVKFYKDFIEDQYISGLVSNIQLSLNMSTTTIYDVVADTRDEILNQANGIRLHNNSLMPLLQWFVPDSRLLDKSWCLINSALFINCMDQTMDRVLVNDGYSHLDYLDIENIYVKLFKKLVADENISSIESPEGFVAERRDNNLTFYLRTQYDMPRL